MIIFSFKNNLYNEDNQIYVTNWEISSRFICPTLYSAFRLCSLIDISETISSSTFFFTSPSVSIHTPSLCLRIKILSLICYHNSVNPDGSLYKIYTEHKPINSTVTPLVKAFIISCSTLQTPPNLSSLFPSPTPPLCPLLELIFYITVNIMLVKCEQVKFNVERGDRW